MRPGREAEPTPLGFKIFLAVAALYLLMRVVQGVAWVLERL